MSNRLLALGAFGLGVGCLVGGAIGGLLYYSGATGAAAGAGAITAATAPAIILPILLLMLIVIVVLMVTYLQYSRRRVEYVPINNEQSSHYEVLNSLGPNQSPGNKPDNGLSEEPEKPGQYRNPIAAQKSSPVQPQQRPPIEDELLSQNQIC